MREFVIWQGSGTVLQIGYEVHVPLEKEGTKLVLNYYRTAGFTANDSLTSFRLGA